VLKGQKRKKAHEKVLAKATKTNTFPSWFFNENLDAWS
jgi:hypothetical protein